MKTRNNIWRSLQTVFDRARAASARSFKSGENLSASSHNYLFLAPAAAHCEAYLAAYGDRTANFPRNPGGTTRMKTELRSVLPATALLATMAIGTSAVAQPASHLEVICDAGAMASCTALQAVIREQTQNPHIFDLVQGQTADLTISLSVTRQTDTALAGFLTWTKPGQDPVSGPTLELSVIDRNLTPQSQYEFARGLLRVSDLPL